jgi:hypothetical protein
LIATAGGVAVLLLGFNQNSGKYEGRMPAEILASSGIVASVELFLVAWLSRVKTAVSLSIRVPAECYAWP